MEQEELLKTNFLTQEEWNLTPSRVKDLVVQQKLTIEELQKELEELKKTQENLQEKVNCNSQNSSIPPSTELIKPEKNKPQKRRKRKRGGQLGHLGYSRVLYDESECSSIENHFPPICKCCGEELSGMDESPYRHQIVEIPPIKLDIIEHRLHQLECDHCGEKTRAKLPESICESGYGSTVVALVALMSGVYRRLFIEIEGLEPTNNEAERAIRPAVLWKRTSFGSQSQEGSIFVGRILTVVTSLRCQNRNVLEFMIEAIKASREGSQTPSLIPAVQTQSDSDSSDKSSLLVA